jgi:hypothetical protein
MAAAVMRHDVWRTAPWCPVVSVGSPVEFGGGEFRNTQIDVGRGAVTERC